MEQIKHTEATVLFTLYGPIGCSLNQLKHTQISDYIFYIDLDRTALFTHFLKKNIEG